MAMQPTFAREGERLLYMNHSRPTTSMAAICIAITPMQPCELTSKKNFFYLAKE